MNRMYNRKSDIFEWDLALNADSSLAAISSSSDKQHRPQTSAIAPGFKIYFMIVYIRRSEPGYNTYPGFDNILDMRIEKRNPVSSNNVLDF